MVNNFDISILVVTHNHGKYLNKLIDSLLKFNIEKVFFCDANSTDETKNIIKSSPYKNNFLSKNILEGFSKNNNDLIKKFNLKSKYYLLLNPDTYFDFNFLEVLYQKMLEDDTIGISSPILKYPDGTLQKTWKKFPGFSTVLKKRIGVLKASDEKQMQGPEIHWCLGACMLINNILMEDKGTLLDERFRLYCEDIDICFKSHVKGLKVIGVSEAVVYHHLNELSSKNIFSKYNFWNIQSIFKFLMKWNVKYFKILNKLQKK